MKFSIITVCLNPGEKLNATLESILGQTCKDALQSGVEFLPQIQADR